MHARLTEHVSILLSNCYVTYSWGHNLHHNSIMACVGQQGRKHPWCNSLRDSYSCLQVTASTQAKLRESS